MPFNPLGFFHVARRLASESPGEAEYRTAVGRAYYCAFLVAREHLRPRLTGKQLRSHTEVIEALRRRDFGTGARLDTLHRLRLSADYQLVGGLGRLPNWGQAWQRADHLCSQILRKMVTIVP